MKQIVAVETFLTAPGVAHSLFHVMIPTQGQALAVMICTSARLMRETATTTTTAMVIFNVELKTVIGHQRLIVAPTLLMKEVNDLDFIFTYFIYIILDMMVNNGQKLNISTSRTCNYENIISTFISCHILSKIK